MHKKSPLCASIEDISSFFSCCACSSWAFSASATASVNLFINCSLSAFKASFASFASPKMSGSVKNTPLSLSCADSFFCASLPAWSLSSARSNAGGVFTCSKAFMSFPVLPTPPKPKAINPASIILSASNSPSTIKTGSVFSRASLLSRLEPLTFCLLCSFCSSVKSSRVSLARYYLYL